MDTPRQTETDSIEYWKRQAKHFEQKTVDLQLELDEYTENSAQLEKELEASLVQAEKQNRDQEHQNRRLKNEIEMLRNKLDRSQHENNALENELQIIKIEKEKQAAYVRELEQKNDDLERGQRVISESVSCIEALLNQAYERNAVLESEVDEIENLRVRLQRADDEARDLKQELKVVVKVPTHKKEDDSTNESVNGYISNSSRAHIETETQTVLPTPYKREINGNAMTPSSRVSAINIVGDLLRKVGLERFLCRECGKVKCSCDTSTTSSNHADGGAGSPRTLPDEDLSNASIEIRNPKTFFRQNSEPDSFQYRPPLQTRISNRSSDRPFPRTQGENGKLRRSFAVRSRESLENFLSFTSLRQRHDRQDHGRSPNGVKHLGVEVHQK